MGEGAISRLGGEGNESPGETSVEKGPKYCFLQFYLLNLDTLVGDSVM